MQRSVIMSSYRTLQHTAAIYLPQRKKGEKRGHETDRQVDTPNRDLCPLRKTAQKNRNERLLPIPHTRPQQRKDVERARYYTADTERSCRAVPADQTHTKQLQYYSLSGKQQDNMQTHRAGFPMGSRHGGRTNARDVPPSLNRDCSEQSHARMHQGRR